MKTILVFFIIISFMLLPTMAFEFPSFPLPNNNSFPSSFASDTTIYNPPLCFSTHATSRFSSTIYTVFFIMNAVFLITVTLDFIKLTFHTFKIQDFEQKVTQDANFSSSSNTVICCNSFSEPITSRNLNLNQQSLNKITQDSSFSSSSFNTVICNSFNEPITSRNLNLNQQSLQKITQDADLPSCAVNCLLTSFLDPRTDLSFTSRTFISSTSWSDHDQRDLRVLLTFSKPENLMYFKKLGSTKRSNLIKNSIARVDEPHIASANIVPNFPDYHSSVSCFNYHKKIEFGVYSTVLIFAHLGYIIAEFTNELDCGQKALKLENQLSVAENLNDPEETAISSSTEEAPPSSCQHNPIVHKQQKQAAAGNLKKDFRLKSLKAADATKRRLEKIQKERNIKKEAFKVEIARRKKERAEELKLILRKEEQELNKIEKRMPALQKYQKLKFESKNDKTVSFLLSSSNQKERNKKKEAFKVEIARRKKERAEELKLILRKEEQELKKIEKRMPAPQKYQKLKFESKNDKTAITSGDKTISERRQNKMAIEKSALKVKVGAMKFSNEESSYIISPCHINPYKLRKFVPSWASENRVAMALPLQHKLDPESIFCVDSFCSIDEVLQPWESK